jgi:hypothetical protein
MRIRKEANITHTQKKTGNTTYLSILTLDVNGLDPLIKIHRLTGWFKKIRPGPDEVANACNPRYLGGRDWEDLGSKPAWDKKFSRPISTMTGCNGICLSSQLCKEAQIGGL